MLATHDLPGAERIELGALLAGYAPAAGAADGDLRPGERTMSAASILATAGRRDLRVVAGAPEDLATAPGRTLETSG